MIGLAFQVNAWNLEFPLRAADPHLSVDPVPGILVASVELAFPVPEYMGGIRIVVRDVVQSGAGQRFCLSFQVGYL